MKNLNPKLEHQDCFDRVSLVFHRGSEEKFTLENLNNGLFQIHPVDDENDVTILTLEDLQKDFLPIEDLVRYPGDNIPVDTTKSLIQDVVFSNPGGEN